MNLREIIQVTLNPVIRLLLPVISTNISDIHNNNTYKLDRSSPLPFSVAIGGYINQIKQMDTTFTAYLEFLNKPLT